MFKKNNMKNTFVGIMAGGAGTRFWPVSRETLPKQFIDILGGGETLYFNKHLIAFPNFVQRKIYFLLQILNMRALYWIK